MNRFFDIIIPRWITEKVAVIGNDEKGYEVICCVDDLHPNEYYDFITTARSFNFFGFSIFASIELPNEN